MDECPQVQWMATRRTTLQRVTRGRTDQGGPRDEGQGQRSRPNSSRFSSWPSTRWIETIYKELTWHARRPSKTSVQCRLQFHKSFSADAKANETHPRDAGKGHRSSNESYTGGAVFTIIVTTFTIFTITILFIIFSNNVQFPTENPAYYSSCKTQKEMTFHCWCSLESHNFVLCWNS